MPGYGFSGKPASTGWGPERMGRAWDVLMERLGYKRYVAQGGDWGAFVVDQMGLQAPAGLLGIHTNLPAIVPADVYKALLRGEPPPAGLSAEERRAYEQLETTLKRVAYARIMASRPQTLYGIADSPVGLAAWLLDHDDAGGQPAAAMTAGLRRTHSTSGELTREEILDNITLFWVTNTAVSASRLYWEYKGDYWDAKGVNIPVAVSVFPGEQYEAPRSWTERAYPNLCTTTSSTKAATSRPGKSRSSSPPSCARPSGRCGIEMNLTHKESMKSRLCNPIAAALAFCLVSFSAPGSSAEDRSIRPFKAQIGQAQIDDMRRRVRATRFPERETVDDFSQGVQLEKLKPLVEYWGKSYDWRKAEAKLNALPQFITRIDGLDMHFIHVRSRHANALPMLMPHGWPGSVFELLKVVDPLVNPTAHGGRAEDAFHLVLPRCRAMAFQASRRKPRAGVPSRWGAPFTS